MLQPFNRLFTKGNKSVDQEADNTDNVKDIRVDQIVPNEYQPRTQFDEEKIIELARTLQTHGIIQPIIVRTKDEDTYEIIAGERRWRASQHLEWETIPAIVRELTDTETASIALIENIQREQLSVIEEAHAYVQLIEMHELTQEALAQRLGKSQSTIANKLRLLHLPDEVQQALLNKAISERHARALMRLKTEEEQVTFLQKILDEKLTVKDVEKLISQHLEKPKEKKKNVPKFVSKDIRIVTNTIKRSLNLIKNTGVQFESEETDHDDYYEITIKVKK